MIRHEIEESLKRAIKDSGFRILQAIVEHPENAEFGDYATSVALQIAKTAAMRSKDVADIIASKMRAQKDELFDKIEIAEPGFINFFISKKYLQNQVGEILKQKESFGRLEIGEGKKVNIEFISANPTGPLHIGNGRSAFAGDTIANVLEKSGYKVDKEYYINNIKVSAQIKDLAASSYAIYKFNIGEKTLTAEEIAKSPYYGEYLKKVVSDLFNNTSKSVNPAELGEKVASKIQQDNQNFIEKKLKIKFDRWVSEKEDIYKKNKIKKILDWLKKNNLVYEKDKALWLKTSQFGDEKDWVVVRETGEPTYLLSDMAYHKDKFDRGFNKVIDIWGADHQAHVSKMKAAAKILGFKGNLDILVLQLVTLRGGQKLSKRLRNIITLEELVDEIGLDVARWFYLQKSLNTHVEIDLDLAKEQSEKNPVFYVQYAHARICSILGKAGGIKGKTQNLNLLNHPSDLKLIKQLLVFPEIVEDIARDYQAQRLPRYAMDLAAVFHQFYQDCQVVWEKNIALSEARLALALSAKIVLKNTLSLMGISAPEKM